MNAPTSVKVLGQMFAIEYVEVPEVSLSKGEAYGRTHFARQRLFIDASLAPDQLRDTLLHEILHCCLLIVGMDDTDIAGERGVAAITPVLLDVLRTNPGVTKWLTE